MICPYGFIKCNTLLFGAVLKLIWSRYEGELGFRTIPLWVCTYETEKQFESALFLDIF